MHENGGWYLTMTKPKMEAEAVVHLKRQGFEVYLPLWLESKRRRGEWTRVELPMFPRYLFLRPGYEGQSLSPIRSTRGVSQLVRFGADPAVASNELVQDIVKLERARFGSDSAAIPFDKGQKVEVVDGPFSGVSAEVLACDHQRVILLLKLLGKTRRLEFSTASCRVL